ncbi:DUF998 domain-containing protein [Kibdelosporangium philippinense]|uniref:DUF998 domain-containing protein n=1 Tax=Kibdelosporangium philippinense TaxID=211113 RepID=A0ABS8ZT70_9PSEU|nr:DUF998 domain-containing protein [Kibdelosporangium philippinense]MCE7010877.1 DUF998 domain-containing protein [Kibdelosporangium philippinense]
MTNRHQPWLIISAVAIIWGVLSFVVLHVVIGRNPLVEPVSTYAFTDLVPGLLAFSILLIAIGSVTTLGALAEADVPLSRTTRVLFGLWSGGLALAAVFPAYGPSASYLSGEIHQYASVIAFLSVPAIGFSVLKAKRDATVMCWTRYSVGSLVLFGTFYLLGKIPALSELITILPVGLTQRITLAVDIGLICSILLLARSRQTIALSNAVTTMATATLTRTGARQR